ncbi:MFS transporter [Streptomyces sp. NPDC057702]|uniref:MFS transporter n=1 Tax=unclassified Streptomyces TaxID=2593676 RepID=UPI0036D06C93
MIHPGHGRRPAGSAALTVTVLLAGEFLAIFDISVVNVLLPTIQHDLDAGDAESYLVVACYAMTYASLLVTGGRLGERHGIRVVFLTGVALFGLASAACALAPTLPVLAGARAAQGVGAALLFPQVLAGIQQVLPAQRRGPALGAFGAVLGAGSTLGQLGGGVLAELDIAATGWRSAFWVNVPLCLAIVAAGATLLPGERTSTRRLDLPGALLLAVTMAAVTLPWSMPGTTNNPRHAVPALAILAGAGTAFVWWERRLTHRGGSPLLHTDLFRHWTFGAGLALCLLFFCTQVPFYVVLARTAQDGAGLSPLSSAMLYAGLGVAFLAASVLAGRLDARHMVWLTTCGPVLTALSYLGLSRLTAHQLHPAEPSVTLLLILNGLGAGLVAPTLIRFVLTGVPTPLAGVASGLLATAQQTANSIGVVTAGAVFHAGGHGPRTLTGFHATLLYFTALAAATAALAATVARGHATHRQAPEPDPAHP